jgi:hypothetical protein
VEHALFHCTAKLDIVEKRGQFVENLALKEPRLRTITPSNGTLLLSALIFRRDTVCQIAKFAHQVFDIFDRTPMVWPDTADS